DVRVRNQLGNLGVSKELLRKLRGADLERRGIELISDGLPEWAIVFNESLAGELVAKVVVSDELRQTSLELVRVVEEVAVPVEVILACRLVESGFDHAGTYVGTR